MLADRGEKVGGGVLQKGGGERRKKIVLLSLSFSTSLNSLVTPGLALELGLLFGLVVGVLLFSFFWIWVEREREKKELMSE